MFKYPRPIVVPPSPKNYSAKQIVQYCGLSPRPNRLQRTGTFVSLSFLL